MRDIHSGFERQLQEATADDYTPEGAVPMDEQAARLLEVAQGLAGDDRWDDVAAVAQLVRLAGRHMDSLRVAEINSRSGGDYQDFRIENRAHRLLLAAVTGEPIAQTTVDDHQRFEVVERFAELSDADAWNQLTQLEPALVELAREVDAEPGLPPDFFRDHEALRREVERSEVLGRRLDTLVGPRSSATGILARSAYARSFAEAQLEQRRRRV